MTIINIGIAGCLGRMGKELVKEVINDNRLSFSGGFEHPQHSNVNRSLFNVDHDHKTGEVRGWICTYCNNMIARARDNAEILRNGAKYLEEKNG